MRTACLVATIVGGVVALACNRGAPTTPEVLVTKGVVAPGQSGVVMSLLGMTKEPISGTIQFTGAGAPGRALITPSDLCHLWGVPVSTHFDGDLVGSVTFDEQQHDCLPFAKLVSLGPFEGEVTWNGRSGIVSGQFTTNCLSDPSQPFGISCDGTISARGSGGLEGVMFHFKWGPGWFPFPYTGTAFSK